MKCKICSSLSVPFAKANLLSKYSVQYFSCNNCGFIQTETPYWLDESYENVIAQSDLGLVGRNIKLSAFCSAFIPLFFLKGRYLDYGGGNGMFVRLMRDRGFDYYWHDKLAENYFANGFETGDRTEYSLVTAFEVFEHLINPLDEIAKMIEYSENILFSTRVLPMWQVEPSNWWYFTLDTGQHISLFSKESLEIIAREFNLKLSSNGLSLHLLSTRRYPNVLLQCLSFYPFSRFLASLFGVGRRSLLADDYYKITGKHLE